MQRERERESISLSLCKPGRIDIANCISARTDRGISNRANEGSGVLELQQD